MIYKTNYERGTKKYSSTLIRLVAAVPDEDVGTRHRRMFRTFSSGMRVFGTAGLNILVPGMKLG